MNKLPYIVAIEIGSSKIVGAIASVSPEGLISVFALEEEHFHDSVRYGCIKNIDDTANRVGAVIEKLENRSQVSPQRIMSVYTGVSGNTLHSITRKAQMPLIDGEPVTEDMIRRMKNDVTYSVVSEGMEIIDVVPVRFAVDNMESTKPVGSVGNKIEGEFSIIVGKEQLRANLRRVISDRRGLEIRDCVSTVLAQGEQVLTSEERRLGAMLVDFGAETTSVVIYKKGAPIYVYTMPIGSRNITRDITSLNVIEEKAESIKKSIGNAKEVDNLTSLSIDGISALDAGNLIVARSGEIVANIFAQLETAGLSVKDIPEGVIVTGGGANLKNFIELISEHFGVKARRGELARGDFKVVDASPSNPAYVSVYSLLAHAASVMKPGESCCVLPNKEPSPVEAEAKVKMEEKSKEKEVKKPVKKKGPNIFQIAFTKVKNATAKAADSVFEDEGDDSFDN